MSLYVDTEALEGIAETLRSAASGLDDAVTTVPGTVEAGAATAALTGILARLTANAGQLVVALEEAGIAVLDARGRYAERDIDTADALTTTWTD